MYKYSHKSLLILSDAHADLQKIFYKAIKYFDISILETYRDKFTQNKYYLNKKTQLKYPNSKHNVYPSKAIDVAPYNSKIKGIDWQDEKTFIYMAGHIKIIAEIMHIKIRWGGDWKQNNIIKDNSFDDWGHFELIE